MQESQYKHNLDQKVEDWGTSVMVTQWSEIHRDGSSLGGARPWTPCCGPGPAARCLYWLEDPITQQSWICTSHTTGMFSTWELLRYVCPGNKKFLFLFSSPTHTFRSLNSTKLTSIFHLGTGSHRLQFLQ